MLTRRFAAVALAFGATVLPASAQSRWSVEGRVGVALPTEKFADVDLGTGVGFGANFRYRIQPHLSAYAGWEWFHFIADDALLGAEADVEETGYTYGLRFQHPMNERFDVWVRAGGTFDHIEIENDAGDIVDDSKHGVGWELGAGLAMRFRDNWEFTPGVRYRSLSRDMDLGATTRSVSLSYMAISVGFARNF